MTTSAPSVEMMLSGSYPLLEKVEAFSTSQMMIVT